MTLRSVWLFIPFLLCSFAEAQEHLVQTGPFGAPVMVADELSIMRTAIVVYDLTNVAFVIPDITSAAWRTWHIAEFRKSGKYPIQLYRWYKNSKPCESWKHSVAENPQWSKVCADLGFTTWTTVVNTRNQTIHIFNVVLIDRDGVSDITTLSVQNTDKKISTFDEQFQSAIERITKIVESESRK